MIEQSPSCPKRSNALEDRIRDITYMLSQHSGKLASGVLPTHGQVTEALQQCEVCYDQLQHITRDYSNTPTEFL